MHHSYYLFAKNQLRGRFDSDITSQHPEDPKSTLLAKLGFITVAERDELHAWFV